MSDKTLRLLVAAVISLLLIYQVGRMFAGLLGMITGIVSAILVAAVSYFSMRMAKAGGKSSSWFLLPTLLFTVVPIAYKIWGALTDESSGLDRLLAFAPFLIGFALPLGLLLLIYYELHKRTRASFSNPT